MLKFSCVLFALFFLASLPIIITGSASAQPPSKEALTEARTPSGCPIECDQEPFDNSEKAYDYGCGTYDWDLRAEYGETEFDEGIYTSYGTCNGGYWNCACTLVPQGKKDSSMTPDFEADPGNDQCYGSYTISWTSHDWNSPEYPSCTNNPNCENAQVETVTAYTVPGQGYDDIICQSCN